MITVQQGIYGTNPADKERSSAVLRYVTDHQLACPKLSKALKIVIAWCIIPHLLIKVLKCNLCAIVYV